MFWVRSILFPVALLSSFCALGEENLDLQESALTQGEHPASQTASNMDLCQPDMGLAADVWDMQALGRLNEEMAFAVGVCKESALLYWQHGVILRRMGRSDDALESLERALLIAPSLADAMLEYALLMEQRGDLASAEALYEELLLQHDPPALVGDLLRTRLIELRAQRAGLSMLQGSGAPALAKHPLPTTGGDNQATDASGRLVHGRVNYLKHAYTGQASAGLVFDSNVNNAPKISGVTLNTIDGPITLDFASSDRPKAALSKQFDGLWRYQVSQPSGVGWSAQARALSKTSPNSAYNLQYLELGSEVEHPFMGRTVAHQFDAQMIRFGQANQSEAYRYTGTARGLFELANFQCRTIQGFEIESRNFIQRTSLDGLTHSLLGKTLCTSNAFSWEIWGRLAFDRAIHPERPGGNQRRADLGFGVITGRESHFNRLVLNASALNDIKEYNPLIEQGKIRKSARIGAVYERGYEVGTSGWMWLLSIAYNEQRSTLSLFETQSLSVTSAWRFRY